MNHKIWDSLAVDYDKSVEDNQDPLIVNYLKKEIWLLAILCEKICKLFPNCSIIDMAAQLEVKKTRNLLYDTEEMLGYGAGIGAPSQLGFLYRRAIFLHQR